MVAYANPKKETENPDFIRLLGQSLSNDLAIIYVVAIWLDICIIGRRNLASYLHDGSRKKSILSLYQVDVQTKHAQNEKHLNSTKRNIKERVRAIYYWHNTRSCGRMLFVLQPSNLRASHSSQLLSFVFLFTFVSWNSYPHYHLLVAYATPKKEAENPDFIRLLGQSLTNDLATIFAFFCMLLACIGQQSN